MRILFSKPEVIFKGRKYVVVENEFIKYIGDEHPDGEFDRIIDGKHMLLIPGLYNCHTHSAMTLFRGYGEDMPLQSWLNDRIFPAEDLLTDRAVYVASKFAAAEMIKNGIVSFTDMYFFCDSTVKAIADMGIKANISRSLVSFDLDIDMDNDKRFIEAKKLFADYHNAADGRIKIDMALHAEYTNVAKCCRAVSEFAKENNAFMHVHVSETELEHNECIGRHGKTPAEFLFENGVFDVPATAAHCVWASDSDINIFAKKGVSVAHNPASNLKLGSGVMPLTKMLNSGVNITLGTDGAASNNTLDILKEMYLAAILSKGIELKPDNITAGQIIRLATENGAKSQGRYDSGKLEEGFRADITALNIDALNNIPYYDTSYTAVYSANSSDVTMTMADGRILYENGEFKTVDIEQLKYDMRDVCAKYFS